MPLVAETLVGSMPSCRRVAFYGWVERLVSAILGRCSLTCATNYYFDNVAGNDSTGDGSLALPWKTIAKAQTAITGWTSTSARLGLWFKRGVTWEETTGLTISKNYITVGAYGTGAAPFFNFFATKFASGGALWTQQGGTARYTTTVNAIGTIRRQGERLMCLRKVASTAEVESTADSWFHTGTTLSLHLTTDGAAVDPDTVALEYTLAATTDDSAIDVGDVTDVRIDGIRADGWGYDGSGANQEYGMKCQQTGTKIVAITNCEAYFNDLHNIGHNAGAVSAGGLTLVQNCVAGYCFITNAGIYVDYAGLGDNEAVFIGNTAKFGVVPATAARDYADGSFGICHTNDGSGSGSTVALAIIGNSVINNPVNGFGCGAGWVFNSNPTGSTVDNCKMIEYGTRMPKAKGTGHNNLVCQPDTVKIGCYYQMQSVEAAGATVAVPASAAFGNSWTLNTIIDWDLRYFTTVNQWWGLYNPAASPVTHAPKFWHCHFIIRANDHLINGGSDWNINYDMLMNGAGTGGDTEAVATLAAGSQLINSIFVADKQNPSETNSNIRVGMPDSATNLRYNAYFNLATDGNFNGSSDTTGALQLGGIVEPLYQPSRSSPLYAAGEAGYVDYDFFGAVRRAGGPTIGPIEGVAPIQTSSWPAYSPAGPHTT